MVKRVEMHVSGDNSVTFVMSSDTSVILDLRSTTTHLSRLHPKRFLDETGTTSPLGYLNPLTRSLCFITDIIN